MMGAHPILVYHHGGDIWAPLVWETTACTMALAPTIAHRFLRHTGGDTHRAALHVACAIPFVWFPPRRCPPGLGRIETAQLSFHYFCFTLTLNYVLLWELSAAQVWFGQMPWCNTIAENSFGSSRLQSLDRQFICRRDIAAQLWFYIIPSLAMLSSNIAPQC